MRSRVHHARNNRTINHMRNRLLRRARTRAADESHVHAKIIMMSIAARANAASYRLSYVRRVCVCAAHLSRFVWAHACSGVCTHLCESRSCDDNACLSPASNARWLSSTLRITSRFGLLSMRARAFVRLCCGAMCAWVHMWDINYDQYAMVLYDLRTPSTRADTRPITQPNLW